MTKIRFGWAVGVGLVLGCATTPPPAKEPATNATAQSSSAQQSPPQGAVAQAEDTRDPDTTLVCEDVKITGSRIPKRVCRTLRQVNEERDQAQQAVRERPMTNPDMSQ